MVVSKLTLVAGLSGDLVGESFFLVDLLLLAYLLLRTLLQKSSY